MPSKSLAFRLVVTSGVVSLVLLVSAALLLNYLFQTALERNFDARLRAVLDGLLANVVLAQDGTPMMSGQIADTRFTLPLSGWYWQVTSGTTQASQIGSQSLLEKRLTPKPEQFLDRDRDGTSSFFMSDSEGHLVRGIERKFKLFGSPEEFSFIVTGNFDELKNEVTLFRQGLVIVLSILGGGLLIAIFLQVRLALRPLQRMRVKLNAIRKGQAERLSGTYPTELQPVAEELNLLLQAKTEIIDRSRTQVGNLAHALKTPISVLINEADENKGSFADKVVEQTALMRDQVNLYLDRARRAANAHTGAAVTDVLPVLQALARTIARINKDREIVISVTASPDIKFRGESQDFEEIAGNLIDNAAKWARHEVSIKVEKHDSESPARRHLLLLTVEDDGPGLPAEKRDEVTKRGKRLDETKPGSGLGLAIVAETLGMYNGVMCLQESAGKGLKVTVELPRVE